jgi:hypothetical protein
MSLRNLIRAILVPEDFYATYRLFRNLGANWLEALKSAVECIAYYRFIIPA